MDLLQKLGLRKLTPEESKASRENLLFILSGGSHYDTTTKKVSGLPGTRRYYHELRHAWQDDKGIMLFHDLIAYPGCLSLAVVFWSPWPAVFLLCYYVTAEIDAWLWGMQEYKRQKAELDATTSRR